MFSDASALESITGWLLTQIGKKNGKVLTAVAVSVFARFYFYATEQDWEITCKEFLGDKDNMPMMLIVDRMVIERQSDNTSADRGWKNSACIWEHTAGRIMAKLLWTLWKPCPLNSLRLSV